MNNTTYSEICLYLKELIKGSQWEGHIYTVGGCCRDTVMQQPINDVDIAVTYPDGGISFAAWLYEKGLTTGEPTTFPKYGTARLRLRAFPHDELELVQTRREKYDDHNSRNPSTVFGTIEDDCYRRDLTINSLYYDISAERLLDISGLALADIENKVIRTPLDPDTTFDDDPLRILRAIRFSAKYGWDIEPATAAALSRHTERLSIIKPERMQGEFEKILLCPRASYGLDMLRRVGAIQYIAPELCQTFDLKQPPHHFGTVWEHTLAVVDKVPATPLLRYAALLHDVGKIVSQITGKDGQIHFPRHHKRGKCIAAHILARLRYRTHFIERVLFLCVNHESVKTWGKTAEKMKDADLRQLQYLCYTPARFDNLMTLIDADNRSYAPEHCMGEQTMHIRRRSEELQAGDTAMFGYTLPLKPSRIIKIKGIEGNRKAYDACTKYLLSIAFANPRIRREQLIKKLQKYNLPAQC